MLSILLGVHTRQTKNCTLTNKCNILVKKIQTGLLHLYYHTIVLFLFLEFSNSAKNCKLDREPTTWGKFTVRLFNNLLSCQRWLAEADVQSWVISNIDRITDAVFSAAEFEVREPHKFLRQNTRCLLSSLLMCSYTKK